MRPRGDDRHARFLRYSESHSQQRSEEHTSELQSRLHLVCRPLLEKKREPPSTPGSRTPTAPTWLRPSASISARMTGCRRDDPGGSVRSASVPSPAASSATAPPCAP